LIKPAQAEPYIRAANRKRMTGDAIPLLSASGGKWTDREPLVNRLLSHFDPDIVPSIEISE
jgi:hypothetical protein